MKKAELVKMLAVDADVTQKLAEQVLDSLCRIVEEELAEDEGIPLGRLGSFRVEERKARNGRNPKTGEPITIPSRQVPVFKVSLPFKKRFQ